jgi:hypothetical protein
MEADSRLAASFMKYEISLCSKKTIYLDPDESNPQT